MKKILIIVGFLLILFVVLTIFMEQKSTQRVPDSQAPIQKDNIKIQNELIGSWVWKDSVDAAKNTITPKDPSKFVITFTPEGRLNTTTDCNAVSGSFIKNEEMISIGSLVSTLMACEGEILESTYATELALASSYSVEGNILKINLVKDAGQMTFVRK